jgi:hypothetical protein
MSELKRWTAIALVALPVGFFAERLTAMVPAADGGPDASMLLNASRATGVACTLGAMATAGVAGLGVARTVGARTGLFAAGVVLAWASAGSATVTGLIRTAQSGEPLRTLAVESAIVSLFAAVIVWTIVRFGRKDHIDEQDGPVSAASLLGLAAAMVFGAVGAWFVAREGLKGQTIAAGVAAGALGALVARVVSFRANAAAIALGVSLLGVVGPVVALTAQKGGILEASYANTLARLALLSPLDWAAGALAGLPIGASWAASMLEKRTKHGSHGT